VCRFSRAKTISEKDQRARDQDGADRSHTGATRKWRRAGSADKDSGDDQETFCRQRSHALLEFAARDGAGIKLRDKVDQL
jgi:hypothetical protein